MANNIWSIILCRNKDRKPLVITHTSKILLYAKENCKEDLSFLVSYLIQIRDQKTKEKIKT